MNNLRRLIPVTLFLVLMLAPVFVNSNWHAPYTTVLDNPDSSTGETRIVDIGDEEFIELGPNEELHRYVLTEQGWTQWGSISSSLTGSEYGNSINMFADRQMAYTPGIGTNGGSRYIASSQYTSSDLQNCI